MTLDFPQGSLLTDFIQSINSSQQPIDIFSTYTHKQLIAPLWQSILIGKFSKNKGMKSIVT